MAEIKDPENTILMELKGGTVIIQLLPDVAPQHVERMKTLARAGAYDNVAFHRVIDGFMAQTGDVQHANMEKDYNPAPQARVGPSTPMCPQNSPRSRTHAAALVRRVPLTPTRPTASSSSTSRTMIS